MELLHQAIHDCFEDCDEMLYLLDDCVSRLRRFMLEIEKNKKHINPLTFEDVKSEGVRYIASCDMHHKKISTLKDELKQLPVSDALLARANSVKQSAREFLRTHQALFGALITATDWQSPSFAHAIHSQAGRQEGTIWATINDYKRDQHADAFRFERAFVKAYIDNVIKFPIYAYATSSGMTAFTTILNFLVMEKKVTNFILAGKSIWFQNKLLIKNTFGDRLFFVEESETEKILDIIRTKHPTVLIFDSLTNAQFIKAPDFATIIPFLVRHAKKETYLIIDNTCLPLLFQPLKYIFGKHSKVRLIVFESLNKYHQFGADRVTGGIIWSYGGDTIKLSQYRNHLGTNIPDASVASLPTPNKKILTKRMLRHTRNAHILASALQSWIDAHPKSPFQAISFPSLPNNPSYAWTGNMRFWGSIFMFVWKEQFQTVPVYQRFIKAVIAAAKKRNVNIVAGSTFGLNSTRIYLTALRNNPSEPFIRVSVGTEDRVTIEAIHNIFIDVISSFTP